MTSVRVRRLTAVDLTIARETFAMMAAVFDEGGEPLDDLSVMTLLARESFWAYAAFDGSQIVGGLTAHALPMTRSPSWELFVYDLAVRPDQQRRGVGARLVRAVCDAAAAVGITEVFVPADTDDAHALAFYRALGGAPSAVTIFSFPGPAQD